MLTIEEKHVQQGGGGQETLMSARIKRREDCFAFSCFVPTSPPPPLITEVEMERTGISQSADEGLTTE